MSFIEIAFQAEVSRFEDSEFEEHAKRHCNEDPDTRGKAIEELRRMIRGMYNSSSWLYDSGTVNIWNAGLVKKNISMTIDYFNIAL